MAHTFISNLIHYVWSTKDRHKIISTDLQQRLWPFIGGIARRNDMKALAIGGVEDHIHMLLSLPATLSIAKAAQLIKGGSSKWVGDTFPELNTFAWQEGYGGLSVSVSHIEDTIAYIETQAEHHRQKTFEEEYLSFLKKHGIEYDEKYLWA